MNPNTWGIDPPGVLEYNGRTPPGRGLAKIHALRQQKRAEMKPHVTQKHLASTRMISAHWFLEYSYIPRKNITDHDQPRIFIHRYWRDDDKSLESVTAYLEETRDHRVVVAVDLEFLNSKQSYIVTNPQHIFSYKRDEI